VSGRSRRVQLLAWALCGCAVALLVLTAVLRLTLGTAAGTSEGEATAAAVEALGFLSFPLVGAVIAGRLPANPYGWLWLAMSVTYGVLALGAAAGDGGLASGWAFTAAGNLAYLGLLGLLALVFLLFPTGRLPSGRWRWVPRATVVLAALLMAATPVVPSVLAPDVPPPWAPEGAAGRVLADLAIAALSGLFALLLVAMASVVQRFRLAGSVERQQLKWFASAAVVNALFFIGDLLAGVQDGTGLWGLAQVAVFSLVPLSVGIAVLRYRLYEIDRIISRTVSYGLLTGGLVVVYLALVAVLRPLLEPLTGDSALAVAGSTLAVAAVFNPARRRVQEVVDRRFDRARYDAGRAVEHFTVRLREEVDLDEVAAGLRDTVAATVAPTRVAVWLRVPSRTGGS